jgi:cation:H+ antiporter
MTHSHGEVTPYKITPGLWVLLIIAILACLPGFIAGAGHMHIEPILGAFVFGLAIFGAAFMLSWAAEAAQIEISQSLAIAILALIAVLPEYAVDFVFTWNAAHNDEARHYAVANMTGANRLLVGLGWPVVLMLFVWVKQKKEIVLDQTQRVEIFYLLAATIYSFTIPLKGSLNLIDAVILVSLYVLYAKRTSQLPSEEPELVGPVKIIANMTRTPRRMATAALFLFSGAVIFFVAEPFAHSLVETGKQLGVNEFLLVQWLAPIASEMPEFLIAATWTVRGHAAAAMRALISSKVNHWTLLIGTIPIVYSISAGVIKPFPLDTLQDHELYLTAAQSLFAVAILLNLRMNKIEGVALFVLFGAQLLMENIRVPLAIGYCVLGVAYLIYQRKHIGPVARAGLNFSGKE